MSQDLLSESVRLDPPQILLFGNNPPSNVTHLEITNKSAQNVLAYKVKTTAPKSYQVRPF